MKVLILFLCTSSVFAFFDYNTRVGARTYPAIGAEAVIDGGYNFLLWGEGNKKKPLYGFIRPAVSVSTSAVINSYDARIEFYPISFLGIIRGYKHVHSDFEDFPFYDCDEVQCTGDLKRDYTMLQLGLGGFGIVALGEIQMSNNSYSVENESNLPVAEFRFAALANAERDTMYRSRYVLGLKHDTGIYGIASEYVHFDESGQSYNMDLLIYTTRSGRSNYTFGIGQFGSSHWAKGLIGVFRMRTRFIDNLSLF